MAIQKEKTSIDDFLYYGVDPKNRTIHFGAVPDNSEEDTFTSFSEKTVEVAIRGLSRMKYEDGKAPVSIYVGSGGGDAYACLYLVDYILSCPFQVKFYGGGLIASAASVLMSVCDERFLFPNTAVMIHEHNFGLHDKHSNIKIDMHQSQVLFDKLCKIYADNSFMGKDFYKKLLGSGRDVWLTPQETIAIGLADGIVPYAKRGNLRKKRASHLDSPPSENKLKDVIGGIYKRIGKDEQSSEITIKIPPKDESDPNVIIGAIGESEES